MLAQQDLSDDDRYFLSCFLMTMSQRVPAQVDHVNDQFSGLLQHTSGLIYSHYVQNPDDLEKMKLEYKKDTGRSDIDDLEPEDLNPSKYKIEANRNMTLLTMIQTATSMADILMQMGWAFLKSEPPHFFITSDYPFCLVDPTNKSHFYSGGLAHKNVEISMPLSRNIAFFAGWKSSGVRWLPVSEDFVEQINTRTVYFASREVIAPKQIFPGSAKLLANLPRS